jgi:hypothetical protein
MNQFFNSQGYNNNNSYWADQNANDDYINNFNDVRFVYCPICNKQAYVKYTKTLHKMLRCDICRILIFANGPISEKYLNGLAQFQESYF